MQQKRKKTASLVAKSVMRRLANPVHLFRAVRLRKRGKREGKKTSDAELQLYAEVLPTGFLHFGYFENGDIDPADMTVNDIARAQHDYARLLLSHVVDRAAPVLDVGCGMGGLSAMMLAEGIPTVAVTPDRSQAAHVERGNHGARVICSKFEELPLQEHAGQYGTVITSESLQYLKLDRALELMPKLLKPGGRWIFCDYFRLLPGPGRRGHNWDDFRQRLRDGGWRVRFERDITPNILPTLKYVNMWATRVGLPFLNFAFQKLRRKRPGVHYLLQDAIRLIDDAVGEQLSTIDPIRFVQERRYVMSVVEPPGSASVAQ